MNEDQTLGEEIIEGLRELSEVIDAGKTPRGTIVTRVRTKHGTDITYMHRPALPKNVRGRA